MTVRLLLALAFLACASNASAQQYGDSYPINPGIDVLGYVFQLTFSDDSDEVSGVATASVRYLSPGQSQFRLDLIQTSDDLDGKGMTVSRVEMEGKALSFRHEEDQIFIDLGRVMAVQERVQVTVRYAGQSAAGLVIGPNKYGDRTFFSDNWSSRVRNWLPVVDHPSDKATTEMIVVAPSQYQVGSNGRVVETTDRGDGSRLTHYKNPVPTATWLYFIGIARFAVQQVDRYEDISIETWVYWQDRDAGFYDFAEPSKKALAYYSDLIGPYVNDRLANVVSNATPGGGMEAASTPAYADASVSGTRSRRWQDVIVHEIAHQWFGNAVTQTRWNDVWMSEGFATYYTLLFRQHLYGQEDFLRGLKGSRKTVTDFYADNYDFQIVRDYIEDLNAVSGPMMYHKGAWVLHMLRERIGRVAYDAGVRTYYAEFMNRNAMTADFRRHLEEASGEDLRGFFDQWLFQGGIPHLKATWGTADGRTWFTLNQTQDSYLFDLDVDVAFRYADGTMSEVSTVNLRAESGQAIPADGGWTSDKEVVEMIVDPEIRVLATFEVERSGGAGASN